MIKTIEINPVVNSEIDSPEKYPSEKAEPTLSLYYKGKKFFKISPIYYILLRNQKHLYLSAIGHC